MVFIFKGILAIKEKKKIDWSKYEDWGNAKSIEQTGLERLVGETQTFFDLRTNNGKLKYEMVLKKPEYFEFILLVVIIFIK